MLRKITSITSTLALTLSLSAALSSCSQKTQNNSHSEAEQSSAAPKISELAPDFTGTDSNGNKVTLSDYRGKYVVLEWTNHKCPFVVKHYSSGNMQRLQQKFTSRDVVWLSVISSARGKQGHISGFEANQLTETRKASPSAVILDHGAQIASLYHAKTTPHMFVINPDGELIYQGAIDDVASVNADDVTHAKNYVDMALSEAMAGAEVTEAQTVPYGCSVKY